MSSFKFNPIRLNRPESDAWANFCAKAGDSGAAAIFDLMVHWVAKLLRDGKTDAEVREKLIGMFYDNVTLMNRGQATRNETIILAKAMVEQAIEAAASLGPSLANSGPSLRATDAWMGQ